MMKMVIGKKLMGQKNYETENISVSNVKNIAGNEQKKQFADMVEIVNKRGQRSKYYSDGRQGMRAEFYDKPVHFYDAEKGEYKEIDTRFNDDGEILETRSNTFKSRFHKHLQGGKVFEMEKDLCRVGLKSLDAAKCGVCNLEVCECADGACDCNKVMVKNVIGNTDIEYVVDSERIKENIIVKEKADKYEFDFDLTLNNLVVGVSADGTNVELTKKDTGRLEFYIPSPIMYDAAGNESEDVYYEIEQDNLDNINIKVVASAEWINESNRVFPVTIDPQVVAVNYWGSYYYTDEGYNDTIFRYNTFERNVSTNEEKEIGHELRIAYKLTSGNKYIGIDSYLTILKNKIPKRIIENLKTATLKLKIKRGSSCSEFCVNGSTYYDYNDSTNRDITVDITNELLRQEGDVVIGLYNHYYKGGSSSEKDIRFEAPVLELSYNNFISSLYVVKAPYKTDYMPGDYFETDGMQVNARYENGNIAPITNYHIEPEGSLATYDSFITIKHNEEDVSVNFAINIAQKGFNDRRAAKGMENVYKAQKINILTGKEIGDAVYLKLELSDGAKKGCEGTPLNAFNLNNNIVVKAENIIGEIKDENLPARLKANK